MRTRTGRGTALAVAAAATLLGVGTAWGVEIQIGNAGVLPEGEGQVTVSVNPEDDGVVATLNDIQFPAGREVVVAQRTITATLAAAIDADDDRITVDNADAFPSFGIVMIEEEEISYSDIEDNTLVVAARGENAVAHAADTPVIVPTNVPECTATSEIVALQKDVVFSFLPDGCNPDADCVGIRAIVIALNNLSEITGTTPVPAYRCTLTTDETEGDFPLGCPVVGGACTGDGDCEETEVCNTTSGTCVPDPPFQPAQAGDSPISEGQVGNLPTTCTPGTATVGAACVGDFREPLGEVTADEVNLAILSFGRGELLNPGADRRPPIGEVTADEASATILNFGRGECNP